MTTIPILQLGKLRLCNLPKVTKLVKAEWVFEPR